MKRFMLLLVSIPCLYQSIAQKAFTLDECIAIAIKNSALTQKAALDLNDASIDATRAKQAMLPSVSAGVGHGLNFGRSIDPSSNAFINQRITRGGFSGQSYLPLWQAGNIKQGINQYNYAKEAAMWDLKSQEDNIRLQVTMAYLQILNAKELSLRTMSQEAITAEQLKRLQNLNTQGAVLPSQLSDMQGQYALDQMNTLDAVQSIKNFTLDLAQLMNIPYDHQMNVAPDPTLDIINKMNIDRTTLDKAKSMHPLIRFGEANIKSAEAGYASVRASRYPTLGFGLNLGSNYSSAFELAGAKVGYAKQLSNNFNYSGVLSLDIPILSGYRNRAMQGKAENAIKRALVNNDLAKNTIQQRIEQALLLQSNAEERYAVIQKQVSAFSESFRISESRFNEGVINSVEYLLVKNNLDRAQIQLISAKYEWAFRNKIVEYYNQLGVRN